MKPDWKDAPEWANWLAMDEDGDWFWYSETPLAGGSSWIAGGLFLHAGAAPNWSDSLTRRPETTKPAEAGSEGQGA